MPHVFLSYVREDGERVHRLAEALRARGIPVWTDTARIVVGDDWWQRIEDAIRRAGFFVACFSAEWAQRERTVMNREIRCAIEEMRTRPYGRPWLLPVRLDPCDVPRLPLGDGGTLDRLHILDLHPDLAAGVEHLASVIHGRAASSAPGETSLIGTPAAGDGAGAPGGPPVSAAPAAPLASEAPHMTVKIDTIRTRGHTDLVHLDGHADGPTEHRRMDVEIGEMDCESVSITGVRRRGG